MLIYGTIWLVELVGVVVQKEAEITKTNFFVEQLTNLY